VRTQEFETQGTSFFGKRFHNLFISTLLSVSLMMSERLAKRILLLGWDGADWNIIHSLLDTGHMPYLQRLISDGVMGNLATLRPTLSPILWTTIATGKRADKHGILGFVEPRPDGSGTRLVSSTSVRCLPLWNILTRQGFKSAVVGWWATHPADVFDGIVVSNLFPLAKEKDFKRWQIPLRAVSPDSLCQVLKDLRVHPTEIELSQLLYFMPDPGKIDQETDRRLALLASLLARCASTHGAGTYIAEHESWDLLAVYYDMIDGISHEFMEFRAPKMDHVAGEDFELYSEVVNSCYQFHDLLLGRYMRLVGPETTIIIVSDHGFYSDHSRPLPPKQDGEERPVMWHREYGILVARGPEIKRDELVFGASVVDIAPTVLAMLGLPVARDMAGRALTQIFERTVEPEHIDSYEATEGLKPKQVDWVEQDPHAVQEALVQLAALGYIEPPGGNTANAIEEIISQRLLALAQVHISAGEYDKALEVLVDLIKREPNNNLVRLHLAQCRLCLGQINACRKLVDEVLAERPESSWGHLLRGIILFTEAEYESALEHFQHAEAADPNLPNLHYRMGAVYLRKKHWAEAERVFRKAIEIDGDSAIAYDGLGVALYRQGRYEDAVENLLRSIGLLFYQPLAHYHLGLSLAASGSVDEAVAAFHTALKLRPDMGIVHRCLSKIYLAKADSDKGRFHLRQAQKVQNRLED
jgi:tetratricopeptide (TPR) repeat protein